MAVTEGNVETAGGGTLSSYRWVMIAGMVLTVWAMTLPVLSFGLLLPEIREEFDPNRVFLNDYLRDLLRVGS